MKRINLILLLFLCLLVSGIHAQANWYDSYGAQTKYPVSQYITGFGMSSETGNSTDNLENAKKSALADLASKIKITVNSISRLTNSEFGKENYSDFQSDVSTIVNINIPGIEKYETHYDSKSKRWMALAILEKTRMIEALNNERFSILASLDSLVKEGKEWIEKGRPDLAEKVLDRMSLLLTELTLNLSTASALGEYGLVEETLGPYYKEQDTLKSAIRSKEIVSEKDLVEDILQHFDWEPWRGAKIAVLPALYKTTDITGPFFVSLKGKLEDGIALSENHLIPASQNEPDLSLMLKGTYYETKNGWRLVYKLNDLKAGKLLGSYEVELGESFVKAQTLAFVPPNLRIAVTDHDKFVAVIDKPTATDFKAWTEKGNTGVVYKRGEIVRFYVQVNRPGYVTLLYHLAGPQRIRVLLFENWRIDPSQIMMPVRIDIEFEVTPPYGSETAQFFYSPDMFPTYETKDVLIEGQHYKVLAEDYDNLLMKTRGLSAKTKTTDGRTLQAEYSLTITTME